MKTTLPSLFLYSAVVYFVAAGIPLAAVAQTVDYGKSYINITKGSNGGTIEPGDTLQIKATFVVKSGTLDSCGFFDNVPTGSAYIPGSLAIITNEGKIYKSFTDAAGDDCGWITGTAITINLGFNSGAGKQANAFRRGQIKNTDKPLFFSTTCIMVASYKIKVTAALGSQINIGGGYITYKASGSSGPITINSFPTDNAAVSTNYGLCATATGTNAIGTEFNGTFGSGKNKNRGASANVPANYTYSPFTTNNPNDYYYGISNNTSTAGAGYSTVNTWAKPDGSSTTHRVFQLWDIIGDHTGAVSPTLGNPPADTVNNNNGGYMLVINASYRIDSAFNQTITGLCPNTYYEFSLWIRNICSKCGCDSNGTGATGGGYIPTAAADSSGVKPNLTFAVNGIDYYTTGDVAYNGKWIKKGFIYLTGPTQTSMSAMVRNNAPGGGGNDWAIDDISIATCGPNLNLQPSPNLTVCAGNLVDMYADVKSYFPNYIYWQWEKSTDGGLTWTNTGVSGTGSPSYIAGQWQYTATYPLFLATTSLNNTMFRIKVASTAANLSNSNCSFSAATTVQVLTTTCMLLTGPKLISFTGNIANNHGYLQWTTDNEQPGLYFDIEKSTDGTHFTPIGTSNATAKNGEGQSYTFSDNNPLDAPAYYRIKMQSGYTYTYSHIVSLNTGKLNFEIKALINPFENNISFDAVTPADKETTITLFDSYGRVVKQLQEHLYKGLNKIIITDVASLSEGTYFLQIETDGVAINKRVVKIKR